MVSFIPVAPPHSLYTPLDQCTCNQDASLTVCLLTVFSGDCIILGGNLELAGSSFPSFPPLWELEDRSHSSMTRLILTVLRDNYPDHFFRFRKIRGYWEEVEG